MKAQTIVDANDLRVESQFVPYSRTEGAKSGATFKDMSLNWKVTLYRGDRKVLTTDYSAGIGNCPSYRPGRLTVCDADAIKAECETGRKVVGFTGGGRPQTGHETIKPDPLDVLHNLITDADVLNHDSFESWAGELGYDTDSRSAERVYRSCLDNALKLRSRLGDELMAELQTAFQDY